MRGTILTAPSRHILTIWSNMEEEKRVMCGCDTGIVTGLLFGGSARRGQDEKFCDSGSGMDC